MNINKISYLEPWAHKGINIYHLREDAHTDENSQKIARQIYKIKPDILLFELPRRESLFDELNKFAPSNKPEHIINEWRK